MRPRASASSSSSRLNARSTSVVASAVTTAVGSLAPPCRGWSRPSRTSISRTERGVDEQHVRIRSRRGRRNHSATDRNERAGADTTTPLVHGNGTRLSDARRRETRPCTLGLPPSLSCSLEGCKWAEAALGGCRSKESLDRGSLPLCRRVAGEGGPSRYPTGRDASRQGRVRSIGSRPVCRVHHGGCPRGGCG
jgi:hypothetical protein